MEKEIIYLTDITLHAKEMRQTVNFSKAAEKGRIYSPVPKDYFKNTSSESTSKMTIELPEDLLARIHNGEVELMMPEDGLNVYAGKDVEEKIAEMEKKNRNQVIHSGRTYRKE